MKEILCNSAYFGVTVSLIGYGAGIMLKKKFKYAFLNPLLISIIFVIGVVMLCGVDYESYENSAQYLSYLLTPATVCLAVPLYQQMTLLKKNLAAVACGILAGVLASLGSVLLLAFLFGLEHDVYVTLLPKSITTAIGMGVSEELGGLVTITVAVIIVTGVIGNVIGEAVCKLFRICEPIAKGLALGTSSHAIGTAKALEMGEVEGAMSSLAIAVAGLLTVIGASVFAGFY
ncbi:MAG: LrgB family protein [Hominisplanchenecus sp.]|uniref:LrgB family protein n=1 Tax=Hominisplanchenecus sp. TaxID=3038130 RepID=UPI003999CD02